MECNVYVRTQYGGYWKRGIANLIDCLLLGLIFAIVSFSSNILTVVVESVIFLAYMIGLKFAFGATLGYRLLGMQLVSINGAKPTVKQIAIRLIAAFFSALAFGLGYLWIALDKNKQAWHDKIAGIYVIRPKATPVGTTEVRQKDLIRTKLLATLAVVSVALFIGLFVGMRIFLKDSEAYASAEKYLKTNPRIQQELGKPVKISWFFTGNFLAVGDYGKAFFLMQASGSKGRKMVTLLSEKSAGQWKTTKAGYTDKAGTFVDITKPIVAVAKKKPPKPAEPTRRAKKRPESRLAVETSSQEVTYSRIDIDAVRTYKGRWVKILMRDGIEREGILLEVEDEALRIEQNFNFGSMITSVKFNEILDLLVSDS